MGEDQEAACVFVSYCEWALLKVAVAKGRNDATQTWQYLLRQVHVALIFFDETLQATWAMGTDNAASSASYGCMPLVDEAGARGFGCESLGGQIVQGPQNRVITGRNQGCG